MVHQTFVWWAFICYIICEIYHQTFGPSHRKCLMCPTLSICTMNVKIRLIELLPHPAGASELTLNVWGPSYIGLTRSISWLLMPWLLKSPGHQQPWYWLYRISRFLSYLRKDFNTCVIPIWRNDTKCKYMFMFPLKNLACKGFICIFYFRPETRQPYGGHVGVGPTSRSARVQRWIVLLDAWNKGLILIIFCITTHFLQAKLSH